MLLILKLSTDTESYRKKFYSIIKQVSVAISRLFHVFFCVFTVSFVLTIEGFAAEPVVVSPPTDSGTVPSTPPANPTIADHPVAWSINPNTGVAIESAKIGGVTLTFGSHCKSNRNFSDSASYLAVCQELGWPDFTSPIDATAALNDCKTSANSCLDAFATWDEAVEKISSGNLPESMKGYAAPEVYFASLMNSVINRCQAAAAYVDSGVCSASDITIPSSLSDKLTPYGNHFNAYEVMRTIPRRYSYKTVVDQANRILRIRSSSQ